LAQLAARTLSMHKVAGTIPAISIHLPKGKLFSKLLIKLVQDLQAMKESRQQTGESCCRDERCGLIESGRSADRSNHRVDMTSQCHSVSMQIPQTLLCSWW
jgi:hypothetical protein